MANLVAILESSLFLWGLAAGGLCLVAVRGYHTGRREREPLPIGGVLIAVATLLAVNMAGTIPSVAWAGLGAVWFFTRTAEKSGASPLVIAAASIPGVVLLSFAAAGEPSWVRVVVIVTAPIIGLFIDDFESRYADRGWGVLFYGLAAFGVFLAVPDTDWARTLFAVMLPLSFLAWPKVIVTMGMSGAYMAAAVYALFASEGAIGRPASVIGAIACLGLLLVEPVVVRLRGSFPRIWDHTRETAILGAVPQLVIVFVTSRVAAHQVSRLRSGVIVLAVLGVAFAALFWATGRGATLEAKRAYDE